MNNKQRSSNDEPNRDPNSANQKQLAEHTARVLELQPLESQSTDDQATAELGRLLRDSASANLPDSNVDLREQLMAELDGESAMVSDQVTPRADKLAPNEVTSRSTGRRFWIAAAASGLLLVGGTIAYNSGFVGTLSNVALLEDVEQPKVNAVGNARNPSIPEPEKPGKPEVVFRMETKTRVVPITRMTTETKSRSVPIQRTRVETKQVKQADGSLKFEEVNVPYTDQVAQSYTVQVPVQDSVPQSYQVPVPYTADGKLIEKSDYGKYGLDVQGRLGIRQDSADTKPMMVFPDADTWRDSQTRRVKQQDFRLSGGQEGESSSTSKDSLFAYSAESLRRGLLRDGDTGIPMGSQLTPSSGMSDAPADADKAKAIVLVEDGAMSNLKITGHPGDVANAEKRIERLTDEAKSAQQPVRGNNLIGDQLAARVQATGSQILNGRNGILDGGSNTLSIPESNRFAGKINKGKPAEYLSGGEIPIEGRTNSGGETTPATPTVTMYNGQSKSGPQSHFYKSEWPLRTSDAPGSEVAGFDIGSSSRGPNGQPESGSEGGSDPDCSESSDGGEQSEGGEPNESDEPNDPNQENSQSEKGESGQPENSQSGRFEDFGGGRGGFGYNYDIDAGGEQYEPIFENAFIAAKGPAAISTFSIDVDTASYANMRRMLNSGRRPPPNSIRLEELVNYFQYDYAQPTGDHPFSVNLEFADCPWESGQQLLRVGLKGKDIHVAERPPTNVVFLIDVSGSMSSNDKLPLLKSGFQMMSRQLGENDRVSIVTYAGNAGVALEPTNGTQTSTINTAIERLSSGGSTHGSAGIQLAYELAQKNFIQGGVNRVMLATDGDLNVGVTSDDALVKLIKEKAAEGVFLTVLGFGTGNLKDGKLEKLADNGNGVYSYIDSTREARRVLVDQLSGSLVTIAKDVKIQVEFNPAEVKSYRLLGYENRMLETKDFDDDAKDAGEIGAGHTVTAIYQIEPAKAVAPTASLPAGMKYQVQTVKPADDQASVEGEDADGLSKAARSGDLATVALRYKQPDASKSERLEVSIKNDPERFNEASADFRFAASVAGFGMFLRNSEHRGSIDAGMLQRIASESIGKDESGYRSEFIDLIRRASNR